MKVIGITGGIASGKSLVINYLKDKGYQTMDADEITHALLEEPSILHLIEKDIPEAFINHKLDKKHLATIIFNDDVKKEKLEKILHHEVYRTIRENLKTLKTDFVFIEVPLLYETFQNGLYDKILVVSVSEDTQLKRLVDRSKLSLNEAKKRIDAQMPLSEKKEKADFVIDNDDDILHTIKQIDQLLDQWNKEKKDASL